MSDVDLSPEVLARVREAADIVEVVSERVHLNRRGRRWIGLCPFHEEKTPSFSVDAERGLFYCFGCHAGGDTIRFVMQTEHLGFVEAVEHLARRFGVELPRKSPEARRQQQAADHVRALLNEAQAFFVEQLQSTAGAAARSELKRRGFAPETWTSFGFGFAPDSWDALLTHLERRHPQGAVVKAGLAVVGEQSRRPYDRFRNRLTFPIHGSDGRLAAFGGRLLGPGEPKYLNSPEGPVFHKRSTLFRLPEARRPMGEAGVAIVVEGYFDCLSLHRAGFPQAVATLGTALTADHARILRRLAPKAILCYDADSAGRKAAAAGAQVLLAAGVDVAILVLPPGKDPDDLIRDDGAEAFAALLESPTPLLDFLLTDLPEDRRERRRLGAELAPLIGSARDPVARFSMLEELARRLDLPLEVLRQGSRKNAPPRPPAAAPGVMVEAVRLPPGERELLRILLECGDAWRRRILPLVDLDLLEAPEVRKVVELLAECGRDVAIQDLAETSEDPRLIALIAALTLGDRPPISEEGIRAQVNILLKRQAELRSRRLQPEIEAAAGRGDLEEVARLQAEKREMLLKTPKI